MNTLYDLLGVGPDADGEALKKAFREAVKATHPDFNAGDPDAPLRFREIVTAYEILNDPKQRAAYNRLLEWEHQRIPSTTNRIIISGAIAAAVATVVLFGGYMLGLFMSIPTTDVVVVEKDDDTSTETAAKVDVDGATGRIESAATQPATQTNVTSQDGLHDKHEGVEVTDEASQQSAAEASTRSGDAQVIADRQMAIGPLTNDANFYRERGIAAYRSGDFPQAIANLDEAIQLNANDAQAYNIRGNVWDELDVSEHALADYDRAIRIDPNSAVFHDRAILWQRKGELDKALLDLDRAIRFSFADANIYCDRGLVWYQKGRHERAIADFNQAIKLDPNFAAACINRGLILHSDRELAVASADSKTIRVDPSIFDVTKRTMLRP